MKAKQFAWIYLAEHGYPGVPSYYGGVEPFPKETKKELGIVGDFSKEKVMKAVRRIGVDWARTSEPYSSLVASFNGTFAESHEAEKLMGTLVLKNKSKIEFFADSIDPDNVFEMMEMISTAKDKFEQMFGEEK